MLVEACEALKSRDFAGDMAGMMLEAMLSPDKDDSPEKKAAFEKHKAERRKDEATKEETRKKFKREVDILKSKLTLILSVRANEDLEVELKKSSRQIA